MIHVGSPVLTAAPWLLIHESCEAKRFSEVYRKRLAPYVWRIGLKAEPESIACDLLEERSVVRAEG